MYKYDTIYKITINGHSYYAHEFIIKKFDYFKPILENRFSGELKVNFDFCDDHEIINEFIGFLYGYNLPTKTENIISIVEMLEYLICNDYTIYKKLIIHDINELLELLKSRDLHIKQKFIDLIIKEINIEECSLSFVHLEMSNQLGCLIKCADIIEKFICQFIDKNKVHVGYHKYPEDSHHSISSCSIHIEIISDNIKLKHNIRNFQDYLPFLTYNYEDMAISYKTINSNSKKIANIISIFIIIPYIKNYLSIEKTKFDSFDD